MALWTHQPLSRVAEGMVGRWRALHLRCRSPVWLSTSTQSICGMTSWCTWRLWKRCRGMGDRCESAVWEEGSPSQGLPLPPFKKQVEAIVSQPSLPRETSPRRWLSCTAGVREEAQPAAQVEDRTCVLPASGSSLFRECVCVCVCVSMANSANVGSTFFCDVSSLLRGVKTGCLMRLSCMRWISHGPSLFSSKATLEDFLDVTPDSRQHHWYLYRCQWASGWGTGLGVCSQQVSVCPSCIVITYGTQPLLECVSNPRSLPGEGALLLSLISVSVVLHFFGLGGLIQAGHWSVSDAASDAFWTRHVWQRTRLGAHHLWRYGCWYLTQDHVLSAAHVSPGPVILSVLPW